MQGSLSQLHVVHAILLRETKTRFGESRLGYLWALAHPVLWIGMFAGLYYALGHSTPPGMPILAFLTTGIVPFSLFREAATRCLSAIEGNKGLLFYPLVRPLDLVIARAILEAVTQLVVMAFLLGSMALWEGQLHINSWMETLCGLGLAAGLGSSFGLVCCGLSVYSRSVERLFPALIRPIFWLSAVFHPVESLPRGFREFLLFNPIVHAIELVRDGWFPAYHAKHVDVVYPVTWILVMSFLGLGLERMARRKLELT
jgi:capsular polysaccharide transport system permease protein